MRKMAVLLLCVWLQVGAVQADSYCVMSGVDNTIIEAKQENERQSVASISKIMTAIVAIQAGDLDTPFAVDEEIHKAYGSSVYLKEGQQVTLRDLLYALMLRSGNDAAVEIAKHVAGSQSKFVDQMNALAAKIGMSNTTFANPSGLDEEDGGNISTAKDMALLMSYAMKNKEFRKITSTKYYTTAWHYRWQNKNKLLFSYPFTNGGKTGFTKKAGRTLVTSAQHDGMESIVVTLRMGDDFAFHEQMHSKVFQTMKSVTLLQKGSYTVHHRRFQVKQPIRLTLHQDNSDRVRIKTHFDHKDFVIEVQRNDDVQVYSFATQRVHRKGWLS